MSRLLACTVAAFVGLGAVASATAPTDGSTPAPASIAMRVTAVPTSTLNTVGAGPIRRHKGLRVVALHAVHARRPTVLAASLAWCPHCAATGWSLAVALSRFGTLTGLRVIDSGTYFHTKYAAATDETDIEGISFFHAHLISRYVRLRDVVVQSVTGAPLQRLTRAQNAKLNPLLRRVGFPALDIGGAYGLAGIAFDPALLHGMSAQQIAGALAGGSGPVARNIDGLANVLTAAICRATGGVPATVCTSAGVSAARRVLQGRR